MEDEIFYVEVMRNPHNSREWFEAKVVEILGRLGDYEVEKRAINDS